jgi:hypothetical protein
LGGAVDDRIEPLLLEQPIQSTAITDVHGVMRESLGPGPKALQVPGRVALSAEELAAHVVIDAVHLVALLVVVLDGFRPDQAARTGDEDPHIQTFVNKWVTIGCRWRVERSASAIIDRPVLSPARAGAVRNTLPPRAVLGPESGRERR